jgi:hypothetical protein
MNSDRVNRSCSTSGCGSAIDSLDRQTGSSEIMTCTRPECGNIALDPVERMFDGYPSDRTFGGLD